MRIGEIGYCELCGKQFEARGGNQKFCSSKCQQRDRWNRPGRKTYQTAYWKQHIEELKAKARESRQKARLLALSHYSGGEPKCAHCGETDTEVLCLDHINGGGSKQRRDWGFSGITLPFWLAKNNYPKGYQVLCANCNMRKARKKKEFYHYGATKRLNESIKTRGL